MFINDFEQCDWIRKQFEPPGVIRLNDDEKLLAWERLLRSTKYGSVCGLLQEGVSRGNEK